MKGISETIKNEAKEQIGWFFGMLLDTLGANLLDYILISDGEGTIRADQGF